MRNLKKVLSLVTVLVMAFSLANVAFAATASTTSETTTTSFTDADSIENSDEVALLNHLGILIGYEDGSYQPAKTVTRAEAAKIVCYLLLGTDAADSLANNTVATSFTDMTGAEWASGFVQYCETIGIINGYGDGTFGPSDTVTTYQFAKMLLCALGYGQKGEYVGTYWSTNVAVQAVKLGILTKGTTDGGCTRDMTALYAYNALFVTQATYDSDSNKYVTTDNETLAVQNFDYITVDGVLNYDTDDGYYVVPDSDSDVSDNVYVECDDPTLLYQQVSVGEIDEIGVTSLTALDETLDTFADGKLAERLDSTDDLYVAKATDTVTVVTDGVVATDVDPDSITVTAGTVVSLVDVADSSDDYSTDGKIDMIVITDKSIGTVDDDGVTVDDDTVSIDGISDITDIDTENVVYPSDLAADDVVLYSYNEKTETYYVEKAQSISGELTGITSNSKYTVNGTKYVESGLVETAGDAGLSDLSIGDAVTFYLDNNSDVVVAELTSDSISNYAAVIDADWVNYSLKSTYLEAKLLFADGTTDVVTIDEYNSEDAVSADAATIAGSVVTFSENADGTYDVDSVTSGTLSATSIVTGTSKIQKTTAPTYVYADSNTVFFLNDGDDYYVYTGIANVPNVSFDANTAVTVTDGSSLDYVYISDATIDGTDAEGYFFLTNSEYDEQSSHVEYDVFKDGATTTVSTDDVLSAITNGGAGVVYSIDRTDSDDYVTKVTAQSYDTGIVLASGGTLITDVTNENEYTYDSSTVVYSITYNSTKDTYTMKTGSVSTYAKVDSNDKVFVVADDDGYASAIYILRVSG
ncbi:MAG: hypothetical protein H6Q60_156 [Oscillospiraceae bacterium]|nr:hypothetical protein [Oscillospiraceae bacterium]